MHVAVIGRGLIGSAAARHLSAQGHQVTLVGPDEPADRKTHTGVFASHYDEGRITRGLDPWPFWSIVSRASIARYRQIEADSGIAFYTEAGSLMAGPDGSAPMDRLLSVRDRDGIACRALDDAALARDFPFFSFPEGTLGLHEPRDAGHISPRRLVAAQSGAAQRNGARIVAERALGIDEDAGGVTVRTGTGTLRADRALVAAGGFTDALMGGGLGLNVYARTAALLELDAAEAARLATMPTLIYLLPNGEDPYMLPPIRYPDGKWYLKMGGDSVDVPLVGTEALQEWFRGDGNPEVGAALEDAVRARMPGVAILSRTTFPCVTTYSAENIAQFRWTGDRIAVATAGCGRGAKCSDELGRLGAELVQGHDLPDWARVPAVAGA